MARDEIMPCFSGLTHDHSRAEADNEPDDHCSVIGILRRQPMYDCLVLVKRYRPCLRGYSLEFPLEGELEPAPVNQQHAPIEEAPGAASCSRRRLISRFIDADDPRFANGLASAEPDLQPELSANTGAVLADQRLLNMQSQQQQQQHQGQQQAQQSATQLVHVPINGLLDRLKNYTIAGIAVDSRVYAFAMGLKTSERLLTTNFERELHESPL